MRRFWHDNKGSLTLEATIVFPFLIGVIILLINLIRITSIYLVMDHAVSETVKQIATHSYPLKFLSVKTGGISDRSPSIADLNRIMQNIPGNSGNGAISGGSDISSDMLAAVKGAVSEAVITEAIKSIAAARINKLYSLGGFKEVDLLITSCKVYNPNSNNGGTVNGTQLNWEDVALSVEYTIRLPVPFLPLKSVTLSNTAVERAWVDD